MVVWGIIKSLLSRKQKSLTTIYVLALSSIAVIAFGFQLIKFTIYSNQLASIDAIKTIEQQKHETERVNSSILNLQITNQKDVKKLLKSLKYRLLYLSQKNTVLKSKISDDLCPQSSCMTWLDKDFLLQEDVNTVDAKVIEKKLNLVDQYKNKLDMLSERLDESVKKTTKIIILLDVLFLGLLIVVLFAQAVWVFRPAVKRLNEALSVRADFISRISHEIRNPMNSIMGMADILRSTKLTTEQKQYVNNLQRSSHVLLDMLNNLVDFSGLENQAIELREARFSVYKLVDKITDIVSIQAHEKNLELIVDIDPTIPKLIYGDVVKVEQVIINLMNNALKFTNKGYIALRVTCAESNSVDKKIKINFEVEDSGIGIEGDQLSRIFNSFVQEDSSIKRRFGGSGLGLAISKELVGLMGSHIDVESEKNLGSTFSFTADFSYDPEQKAKSMNFIGEKLIYLTGSKNQESLLPYLRKIADDFKVIYKIKDLEAEVQGSLKNVRVIVDDSLGIINIINAATILKKSVDFTNVFALMRSNFSKENMELIRKNGYKNFLIKPFRAWHLSDSFNQYQYLSEEASSETHFENFKGEVKGRKLSILAVDDSNDNLFLLKEILNPITDKIDFANNGLEACEQVEKKPYDIIFMDIQMPVMDGYTAINKIRHKHKHRKIPVYAITAHAGLVDEKKCKDAGFTGRLTKPVNRQKIYNTIQKNFGIEIKTEDKVVLSAEERMLQKLMPKYFEARIEDIEVLKTALANSDFVTIKKLGHRIQGSAKSYGFEQVGLLSKDLEKAAENTVIEKCRDITFKIEQEISSAQQSFNDSLEINS